MASEADLDNFERRAAEAEAQIQALEKRLAAVEKPASKQDTDLAPLLAELRRILALVNAEEKQAKALLAERDQLKVENQKLQYRVALLVRSLEEEENKNRTKQ